MKMHDGVVRTFTNVRHISDLKKNLISLGVLDSQGCKYSTQDLIVIKGRLVNGLYLLQGSTIIGATSASSLSDSDSDTIHLWHMRLGHMSEMSILSKYGLLSDHKIRKLNFCKYYVYEKQTRVKFTTTIHRTKGTMDYIHSDLWGPAPVPPKSGDRYLLTFIDDFLRKVYVYFLKHKNDVFHTFKKWKALVEN